MTEKFQEFKISAPNLRVCFWGAQQDASLEPPDLTAQLVTSGHNSGNLFIGAGLYRNLVSAVKEYHPGFGTIAAEDLHRHYDCIFIPASNFVSASVDLTSAYDYLSKTALPMFCFGLGSQFLPDQSISLPAGTDKFLRLLSERSGSIGVRGDFTANLLDKIGIQNIDVVGCPSFLSMKQEAISRLSSASPGVEKIAVNFSNNVRRHALSPSGLTNTENALFRKVFVENSFYILQNEHPEMIILENGEAETQELRNAIAGVAQIFDITDLTTEAGRFLRQRLRMFFNVDVWIACMRSMSGSIGSRFHGNVAALLAGTPALMLAHDMRTCELCEFFQLPNLVIDRDFTATEVVEAFLEADYAGFPARLSAIHAVWEGFLQRNGLARLPQPLLVDN